MGTIAKLVLAGLVLIGIGVFLGRVSIVGIAPLAMVLAFAAMFVLGRISHEMHPPAARSMTLRPRRQPGRRIDVRV